MLLSVKKCKVVRVKGKMDGVKYSGDQEEHFKTMCYLLPLYQYALLCVGVSYQNLLGYTEIKVQQNVKSSREMNTFRGTVDHFAVVQSVLYFSQYFLLGHFSV